MERNLSKLNLANNLLLDEGLSVSQIFDVFIGRIVIQLLTSPLLFQDLCKHLGKLCNLTQLDLSGNNVSAQGISELAKASEKGFLKVMCLC